MSNDVGMLNIDHEVYRQSNSIHRLSDLNQIFYNPSNLNIMDQFLHPLIPWPWDVDCSILFNIKKKLKKNSNNYINKELPDMLYVISLKQSPEWVRNCLE